MPRTLSPVVSRRSESYDARRPSASPADIRQNSRTPKDPTDAIACDPSIDETLQKRIDRLGRERPPAFASLTKEVLFVFSISMSQLLTEFFVSGFPVILPILIKELDIPQASSVWPATAFSLAIASTLLLFGRVGDMFGGYPIFLAGLVWLLLWTIIVGFSVNPLMLDCCRALQGLGAAAFLPTGVGLMGSTYRPGPRKNVCFAIYGIAGVFGFFGGIFVAGFVGQFLRWGWYFWIGGILTAITLATSIVSVPSSLRGAARQKAVKMDYLGVFTIVPGIVLVVFAITQSAHAPSGWRTPYIPVCFALGMVLLLIAAYVEAQIAAQPLLPASLFKVPAMTPLLIALFLLYGTWGIFSVYGTLYFQNIMAASPLQIVAWYTPIGVAGLAFGILEGFILHLVPGKVLLIISGLGALGSQLLIALIPTHGANYWAWVFPATIFSTIGIDLSTILMTVFITTMVPVSQQGLAGSVINSVLQLGVALVLGLTDIIQSATVDRVGLARSYKNTFWFGVGAGAAALIIFAIWGKVPKATGELTAEEREELMREATNEEQDPSAGEHSDRERT